MYHEVMRPSATFATTISQAAELRGICYLGSLLLFPHLDSYTSLRHHPPPPPELTGTSGDECGVKFRDAGFKQMSLLIENRSGGGGGGRRKIKK